MRANFEITDGNTGQPGAMFNPLDIDLSGVVWTAAGRPDADADDDPKSRLVAVVRILGVAHHLEAIEVDADGDAMNPDFNDEIRAVERIAGSHTGKPPKTVDINGRNYALVVTPIY